MQLLQDQLRWMATEIVCGCLGLLPVLLLLPVDPPELTGSLKARTGRSRWATWRGIEQRICNVNEMYQRVMKVLQTGTWPNLSLHLSDALDVLLRRPQRGVICLRGPP